jgi:hypothetical protein
VGHSVEPGSPTQFANVSAALLHGVRHHTATAYRGLVSELGARFGAISINLSSSAVGQLVANLDGRSICIIGIEGGIQPTGKFAPRGSRPLALRPPAPRKAHVANFGDELEQRKVRNMAQVLS